MKKLNTRELVFISVFAAIISVFSQIVIPFPSGVPITFQTFIIALTGYCLGSIKGSVTVLVYIALGIIGVPVFSGFRGGLGAVFDVTGGFIVGFVPMAFLCGIQTESKQSKFLLGAIGVVICHIFGVLWFAFYSKNLINSFISVSLPYLLKDFISIFAAFFVAEKCMKTTMNSKVRQTQSNRCWWRCKRGC